MTQLIRLAAVLGTLVIAGAGCSATTQYWCHPSKTPMTKAFDEDRYACDGESYKRAKDRGEQGDKDIIKEEWERCMHAKGWAPCPKYQKQ